MPRRSKVERIAKRARTSKTVMEGGKPFRFTPGKKQGSLVQIGGRVKNQQTFLAGGIRKSQAKVIGPKSASEFRRAMAGAPQTRRRSKTIR